MFSTAASAGALLLTSKAAAVLMHNALAVTPQMGWDNWVSNDSLTPFLRTWVMLISTKERLRVRCL